MLGRTLAFEFELGEARQVQHADPLAHRGHLLCHRCVPNALAPERQVFCGHGAVQVEVNRTLPAATGAKAGALGFEGFIQG